MSTNQQKLYAAKDSIAASWLHGSGITGTGSWNFGAFERQDEVTIYGNKGRITFAVFEEVPLVLTNESGTEKVSIAHPENIQLYHVQNMREHLLGNLEHPSTGHSATHTNWVLDKIIGTI